MTEKSTNVVPLAPDHRGPPVKVKLERVNCDYAKPCPPDDLQGREWLTRLKTAFATLSPDFVKASFNQLVMAARLPAGGVSEIAVNAALAFIEGAKPRDEVEAALVWQMACAHSAAMAVLRRIAPLRRRSERSGCGRRSITSHAPLPCRSRHCGDYGTAARSS